MSRISLCSCLICFVLMTRHTAWSASQADYYRLYDTLFKNYTKEIRPALEDLVAVNISLTYQPLSLIDVNEKQQMLTSAAVLSMTWEDSSLKWHPDDFGGIETLLVPQKIIYVPDVAVDNTVKEQQQLGHNTLQVRLHKEGMLAWEPSLIISTACDMDVTYFPFDTQTCHVIFTTSASSLQEIELWTHDNDGISLSFYSKNGQWDIIGKTSQRILEYSTKIKFGLKIKRRPNYYVMNILIPVLLLSMTSCLVFALPFDAGEKMGTGFTILLAFAVYITIISSVVPKTSRHVSILGLYMTIILSLSAVSVILCVFILLFHFREPDCPVGFKTTKLVQFIRRRLLCWKMSKAVKNQIVSIETSVNQNGCNSEDAEPSGGDLPEEPLTWKVVSTTLDSFCLFVFSFLNITVTLAGLISLGVGGYLSSSSF